MAAHPRKTTGSCSSSSLVRTSSRHSQIHFKLLFHYRRPDLLFDKSSSSSADLHEPGEDSIHNNFVFQPKNSSKTQQPVQLYL